MNRHQTWFCILAVAALYAAALGTGCAHSARPRTVVVSREILNGFACEPKRADTDEELAAAREARYAALHLDLVIDHVRFVRHGSDTDQEQFAAHGQACASASDRAACEAKLSQLEATGRAKRQVFAITIARDDLKLYEARDVIALLGAIDNADKAWLTLMIHHPKLSSYACNDPEWDGWRETPTGYDLAWVWTDKTCRPFQRLQAIDHIDRDGNATRLRVNIAEHHPDRCLIRD